NKAGAPEVEKARSAITVCRYSSSSVRQRGRAERRSRAPGGPMDSHPINYSLLLDLYKGKGLVVENLSVEARAALTIETPLFRFFSAAGRTGRPRHIFLTGNAGDGKTFASLTADAGGFTVVRDASAGEAGEVGAPVEELARRLAAVLGRGERLLVAINRGQL